MVFMTRVLKRGRGGWFVKAGFRDSSPESRSSTLMGVFSGVES